MANRVIRWSGTEPPPDTGELPIDAQPDRLRLTTRGRALVALATAAVAIGLVALVRVFATDLPVAPEAAEAAAPAPSPSPRPPAWEPPTYVADPVAPALAASASAASHALAEALFERAPVVVVAPVPDGVSTSVDDRLARWLAVQLRAPLVHVDASLARVLRGLGTRTAVTVGLDGPALAVVRRAADEVRTAHPVVVDARLMPAEEQIVPDAVDPKARDGLDDVVALARTDGPPVPAFLTEVRALLDLAGRATVPARPDVAVLARSADPAAWALVSTAGAAGLPAATMRGTDPRLPESGGDALLGRQVLTAGTAAAWADAEPASLSPLLATIQRGLTVPGGGQTMLPGKLLVALYGHPGGGALGVLGEQPVEQAIERARDLAGQYAAFAAETVVPTFEIIATVASREAGVRGDYSRRTPIDQLRPWVDAAREAGVYVVLDLQPGRTSFLAQAQEYEELLLEPHVGLALDPEWRLRPNQVHLRQIGSVTAAEVNATADWLAALVRANALPQKVFIVHQFKLSMIADRPTLALGHPELAPIIHIDGQGGQAAKDQTYRAVTQLDPPPFVYWGWKNFYDEDVPGIRSPEATYAVEPRPVMVSYQ